LNGTQLIASNTQDALNRTWDTVLGGLNGTDFAAIIKADPFATNPAFDPQTDTSGRYVLPNGIDQLFSYEPEAPGLGSSGQTYASSYNTTNSNTQGGSDKYTVAFSLDATLSASFFGTAFGQLKTSTTFTYTNTWSSTVTAGTTQSANFTIFRPLSTDGAWSRLNLRGAASLAASL
jgi:hypothetical protein